jgi:hypothetical protein
MQNAGGLALKQRNVFVKPNEQRKLACSAMARKGRMKSNDVTSYVELSFASRGNLLAAGVWVHLSSEISETTERIQLIRVPEPASQVPISVVSDISDDIFSRNFPPCIFDENVGFTSALFAYPRKSRSSKLGSAFGLHAIWTKAHSRLRFGN